MKEKKLLESIEEIVAICEQYQLTGDEINIVNLQKSASALSDKLRCSITAAICFAFIFNEAAWGRMPSRSDIMKWLPRETSLEDRLRCVWELIDMDLVCIYRPHRNPIRQFYLDQGTAEAIVCNRLPDCLVKSSSENSSSSFIILRESGRDFDIMFKERRVGFVLKNPTEKNFDVFWGGELVYRGDKINEIVVWLNNAYERGILPQAQD